MVGAGSLFHSLLRGGVIMSALTVAACGSTEQTVGEALGYERSGPDEMNVIKRPPLTLPPDYNLRPPRPADPGSEAAEASVAARETLVGPLSSEASGDAARETGDAARATLLGQPARVDQGTAADTADEPSAGQAALLSRTNRVTTSAEVPEETRAENRVDGAFLRQLLTWTPENSGVDAVDVVTVVRRNQTPSADIASE